MSIELGNSLNSSLRFQESNEQKLEFDRRMKKAEAMPRDKINPERVQKEWDNASSDFYRDHLTLNVFCYEAIRSMKQRRVEEDWTPSNHILSRMSRCLNRMKIAGEYAKRRDSLERAVYWNQDRGFWLPFSIITLDIGISGALIGLLFENALSQVYENFFEDNSTSLNTTSIAPKTESNLRSFGPILRISMNILSIGFGRIKEKVEKSVDKYNQRLGLLEHVLGVRDQKSDNPKYDSDFQIEDFKAKLNYWEGLTSCGDLIKLKSLLALSPETIEARLDKALTQLNSWGVDGGGFKKDSWIGDDLSTMYVSTKEAMNDGVESKKCSCGKLFRSSNKYRLISFKRLLRIKEHINLGRDHITQALESARAKIEGYLKRENRQIDLNLEDELTIVNTKLQDLEIIFSYLRKIPKEDSRKVKKLMEVEKGIKLGVELTALLIVVYDQYSELVGDPISGVVLTAFVIYFIAFILARSTECVNGERRKQADLAKEVAVILKLDTDYVPEIKEMKDYLQKYQSEAIRRKEYQLCKEADEEIHLNATEDSGVLDAEWVFAKRLSSLNLSSSLVETTARVDLKRIVDECKKESSDTQEFFKTQIPRNGLKVFVGLNWVQNKREVRECKLPKSLFLDSGSPLTSITADFESKFEEKDAQFC